MRGVTSVISIVFNGMHAWTIILCRFIVSFETIISEYAAQIPTNEYRTFNTSFLLVLAENVIIIYFIGHNDNEQHYDIV